MQHDLNAPDSGTQVSMQTPCHSHPDRRLRLLIAFDGSGYHGWQSGRSGRGVADVIQRVLADCLGVADDLVSSSRTDSGVHAFGLVAHADVPEMHAQMQPHAIRSRLNARLPINIRVREADWVSSGFHARFDAMWKEYRYQIWNDAVMNPLLMHRAWHVVGRLDMAAMKLAAAHLIGTHDFSAFTSRRQGVLGSGARTLHSLTLAKSTSEIRIALRADGFLYKMCRRIVGTLVEVGLGRIDPLEAGQWLEPGASSAPGVNAPAHGLILWKVGYPRGGTK